MHYRTIIILLFFFLAIWITACEEEDEALPESTVELPITIDFGEITVTSEQASFTAKGIEFTNKQARSDRFIRFSNEEHKGLFLGSITADLSRIEDIKEIIITVDDGNDQLRIFYNGSDEEESYQKTDVSYYVSSITLDLTNQNIDSLTISSFEAILMQMTIE